MSNTSATGGYLLPTSGPIESQAFMRFLHSVFSGITGIGNKFVRPMWQKSPPPVPDVTTNWMAFGITSRTLDNDTYLKIHNDGAVQSRHEEIEIGCVFYGPDSLSYAALMGDGFYISQNRESLFLANMGFKSISNIIHSPELINQHYYDRSDVTVTLVRQIQRDYPILTFVSANGTITGNRAETSLVQNWQTPSN